MEQDEIKIPINKKIIAGASVISVYLFYLIGIFFRSCGDDIQKILHVTSDWTTGIGLIIILTGVVIRFIFPPPPSKKQLNETFIFILTTSSIALTCFMYHMHNIFHLSSVNNDLCAAAWNFITIFSNISILVLWDEYLKLRAKWRQE